MGAVSLVMPAIARGAVLHAPSLTLGGVLSLPAILIAFDVGFTNRAAPIHYVVMGLAALAMGIQASSLRRVGSIAVATTYGTGTIVRIGEKLALGLRRAERSSDDRRSATIVVLVGVLACYVVGAAAASALGSSPLLLLVPAAVLLMFAVYVRSSATRFTIR